MLKKWPQLLKVANFAETHFNVVLEACNVTFSIACHKLGSFHMKHDLLGLYIRQCSTKVLDGGSACTASTPWMESSLNQCSHLVWCQLGPPLGKEA